MWQDVRMLSTDVCVPLSNFSLLIEQTEKDYEGTAAEGIPLKCNIFGRYAKSKTMKDSMFS